MTAPQQIERLREALSAQLPQRGSAESRPPSCIGQIGGLSEPPSWRRRLRSLMTGLACFALLAALVARFTVQPVLVTSSSMRPTLDTGDRVLVEKVTYRFRAPHRGELVVIADPHGGTPLVKRVVAVGGDRVELDNGVLVVNDRVVPDGGAQPETDVSEFFGPVDVPRGHLFVLGDNRGESDDSREFGSVAESQVIGRVWLRG